MGILDVLFGRRDDPTQAWPDTDYTTPHFDLESMTFGSLRFGCDLQDAKCFGKPDMFTWSGNESCELLFARGGFQLGFEANRLIYIAFFIGKDKYLPDHPAMSLSKPEIKDIAQLTHKTSIGDLSRLFGSPESQDMDGVETILTYTRSGITLEFELNPSGLLTRWNLFPVQ